MDKAAAEIGAAAGLDLFGSNAGLILKAEDRDDWADCSDAEDATTTCRVLDAQQQQQQQAEAGPSNFRSTVEQQAAYIAQLEEQNLNLQERLFLLEQELQEAKVQRSKAAALEDSTHTCCSEDGDEDDNPRSPSSST